jgi:hypothetical protein
MGTFLWLVLCPRLPPGKVVIMDNLSVHKVGGGREQIEAAEARLLYLHPTHPTSTPLNKPGRKSNKSCVH